MTLPAQRPPRSRGLSLVELMVALVVGLLLMAGAISIFLSNKRTYEITDDLSRLQENARFALETMLRDLRMAGNLGCGQRLGNLRYAFTAPPILGLLWDLTTNIEGLDDGATAWSPSGRQTADTDAGDVRIDTVGPLAGTDAITVRYAAGPGLVMTAGGTVSGNTIPVDPSDDAGDITDDGAPVQHNILQRAFQETQAAGLPQFAVLTHCDGVVLFQVSDVQSAAVVSADTFPDSFVRTASTPLPMYPRVMPLRAARYFVGDGTGNCADDRGNPVPALYRTTPATPAPEAVVCGVENMQILYGIDTNGDERPDSYVTAGSANLDSADEWGRVISVKLGLLLRTVDEFGTETDGRAYDLFTGQAFDNLGACGAAPGCIDPPDLRVRRRAFSTTVFLRNPYERQPTIPPALARTPPRA